MKKFILSLIIIGFIFSCVRETETETTPYISYEAVVMARSEFEKSIALHEAKDIKETGKIYVIDKYLFINEPHEGFHIVNNNDPNNPEIIKFLSSPGATDLISKGTTFYINQAVDLVAINLNESMSQVAVTKRIKNIFPQILSPDGFNKSVNEDKVVVKWNKKLIYK